MHWILLRLCILSTKSYSAEKGQCWTLYLHDAPRALILSGGIPTLHASIFQILSYAYTPKEHYRQHNDDTKTAWTKLWGVLVSLVIDNKFSFTTLLSCPRLLIMKNIYLVERIGNRKREMLGRFKVLDLPRHTDWYMEIEASSWYLLVVLPQHLRPTVTIARSMTEDHGSNNTQSRRNLESVDIYQSIGHADHSKRRSPEFLCLWQTRDRGKYNKEIY